MRFGYLAAIFLLATTPQQALSIAPLPQVAVISAGIGFDYIPETLATSCRGYHCMIEQGANGLRFTLVAPGDLSTFGANCDGSRTDQRDFSLVAAPDIVDDGLEFRFRGNCEERTILARFTRTQGNTNQRAASYVLDTFSRWRVCTLQSRSSYACSEWATRGDVDPIAIHERVRSWLAA